MPELVAPRVLDINSARVPLNERDFQGVHLPRRCGDIQGVAGRYTDQGLFGLSQVELDHERLEDHIAEKDPVV